MVRCWTAFEGRQYLILGQKACVVYVDPHECAYVPRAGVVFRN